MKTWNPNRQNSWKTVFAVLLALCVLPGVALATGTSAGERIQNQATATYVDANLNAQTAQSNIATVEVGQVYSATLAEDRSLYAASGQSVNFSHVLANTGNGEDTYTIALAQGISGGDDLDFDNLAVYIDQNGDGVATAGETLITNGGGTGTVTLQADTQLDLVVLAKLPTSTPGQTAGATLTVTPTSGTVDDLTAGNGVDTLNGTNEDLATVTDNAVLNVNKSSTYNDQGTDSIVDDTVTFVVTITNTGPVAAYDVEIQDALDLTVFDVTDVTDIVINATEGDYEDTAADPAEGTANTDTINGFDPIAVNDADNDSTTGDFGVRGHDDVLNADETISFTYTVPVIATLPAGTLLRNSVNIRGDKNDDGDDDDAGENVTSNITTQIVPQVYGVTVTDTGVNGAAGVNDGGDDDSLPNDTQQVNTAASGEQVLFKNIITNNGNGTDTFELTAVNGNFPAGTVFSFWQADGTTALLDTNDDGAVDTGPMAAGEVKTIMIKAQLPAGAYDGDGSNAGSFTATVAATSAGDATTFDDATEELLTITAPMVDLSNEAAVGASTPDGNPLTNEDAYPVVGSESPTTTYDAAPGVAVNIPLTIQNDSGVPDSFQLTAGGSWNGAVLGGMPTGWSYVFKSTAGNTITTTPAVSAGGSYSFYLKVTVPSTAVYALADYSSDFDGDATVETIDGSSPADGDGDYPIFIRVVSTNTGASDIKLDAIDVTDSEKVTLQANQTGQIQPGGSIAYPHTLRNDGNTVEAFTLSAVNSLSASGWGNNILVDTTGDGSGNKPFSTLAITDSVFYTDAAGAYVSQVFGQTVANSLVFAPGEKLAISVLEFAPSSAPDGTLDILTITATYNAGASKVVNIDQTTVIQGQIRLSKTVAVDAACNGVADEAFAVEAASKANPEECVSWRLVVTNEGTAAADDVVIYDTVPAFSDYVPGSLLSGAGDFGTTANPGASLIAHTDADDAEARADGYNAKVVGDSITFELGTIASGASVTLQFQTKVQ